MKCFYCEKESGKGQRFLLMWNTPHGSLCKKCIDEHANWLYAKKKGGL
jgi:hypothetical protein